VIANVGVLKSAGVEARAEILNNAGRAAKAIPDAADVLDVDVLVAGWRRRQTLGGLHETRVGQELAARARRPQPIVK
jgi:hypothetical protein